MPRPTFIPPAPSPTVSATEAHSAHASIPTPRRACRVFISYAHRDETATRSVQGGGYPSAFWTHFRALLEPLQADGVELDEVRVFFDQERLRTEDRWSDAIERALDECEVFIFLVSVNSLTSRFCKERELQKAVLRGVPIVPVLLADVYRWADHVVPGVAKFRLGDCHSGGLPKGPDANVRPVSLWDQEDAAWARVCADLDAFLRSCLGATVHRPQSRLAAADATVQSPTLTPPTVSTSSPSTHPPQNQTATAGAAAVPRQLLPYFCNQTVVAGRFEKDLVPWGKAAYDRALLVLAKGDYWDGLEPFVDRLRRGYLLRRGSAPPRQAAPLAHLFWPAPDGSKGEELLTTVVAALYEALGLNRCDAFNALPAPLSTASLEANLRNRNEVAYLLAALPACGLREAGASVQALLQFLERCTASSVLGRLEIVLLIEEPKLVECKSLKSRWRLDTFQRTHVVELEPLVPIDRRAAEDWHRQHGLEDQFALPRPALLANCFQPESRRFRMREFAEQVRPLLGRG